MPSITPTRPPWASRWPKLARAAGIRPEERLLLALSGGADSVLLLHLLAASEPRPLVRACHVDHGQRGAESDADARFCENLCRALGVPFARREAVLSRKTPSLEARLRTARYQALGDEARASGHTTILTGHHSDDALETLLQRWIRGTALPGLVGPRAALEPRALTGGQGQLRIVRPLLTLRREEVRRLLSDRGLRWREDSSNRSRRFTRNRVRHGFMPFLAKTLGEDALENLRAFGRAVESLEERLAGVTAHLEWQPHAYAAASRGPASQTLGGVLARSELMRLAAPLRRRALWRLLTEGTGHAPSRRVLESVLEDLSAGRCTRRSLPADRTLVLRSSELLLLPPGPPRTALADPGAQAPCLPFPLESGSVAYARTPLDLGFESHLPLPVPGIVTLPDGRRLSAERVRRGVRTPPPNGRLEVELDATDLPLTLGVRWAGAGDRFHALGAPGSRPLRRFLADRGVPREERGTIPVVVAGSEIIWVSGIELAERHRVRPSTEERLRLTLHAGSPSALGSAPPALAR